MNAEVAFLVFILYLFLFLDLYSTFEKLFYAYGDKNTKTASQEKKNSQEENRVGRETLAMRKFTDAMSVKRNMDLPEVRFGNEIFQQCARANRQTCAQKARLWGRT